MGFWDGLVFPENGRFVFVCLFSYPVCLFVFIFSMAEFSRRDNNKIIYL